MYSYYDQMLIIQGINGDVVSKYKLIIQKNNLNTLKKLMCLGYFYILNKINCKKNCLNKLYKYK